jgi:dynein heavy chain
LKKLNFINLIDSTLLSACAPPGGGRNPVTPRFFRFFNIIWMPELSFKTLEYIYTLILKGFLKENPKDNISNKAAKIVKSSIDIYQKLVDKLLPTP